MKACVKKKKKKNIVYTCIWIGSTRGVMISASVTSARAVLRTSKQFLIYYVPLGDTEHRVGGFSPGTLAFFHP
jgi:hypothetical protein